MDTAQEWFVPMIVDRRDGMLGRDGERDGSAEALSLATGVAASLPLLAKGTHSMVEMTATIYHNPACGTSRNVLALIRHAGIEPTIVDYLKTPPSSTQLKQLIDDAGLTPRAAVREKEKLFRELGLDVASTRDDMLLDAMVAHPILINRPFVVTPLGTRLCRPSEQVVDILPAFAEPFIKEDGEVVTPRG